MAVLLWRTLEFVQLRETLEVVMLGEIIEVFMISWPSEVFSFSELIRAGAGIAAIIPNKAKKIVKIEKSILLRIFCCSK